MLKLLALPLVFLLLNTQHGLANKQEVNSLVVVDIDNTLGIQSNTKTEFSDGAVAQIEDDVCGSFYFYPGAIEFMKTLFDWKTAAAVKGKRIEVALFTMGSGNRNEIIRDYIEDTLQLERNTIAVYDYSYAVFSEEIIKMWKTKDPALPESLREYFDSLKIPIANVASFEWRRMYYKDLSKLLPFYSGLSLEHATLIDDNKSAVPESQANQLIWAHPEGDFSSIIEKLSSILQRVEIL